ncbi:vitamin B12-dependent ribonucleotide reductase [Pseudonocardia acaciae]|uniref:vitamin B12-dependent ribonucleotide reductase n=1 Tax=Pseudonocardia acaciae TaxID=551276 RepID=UPI000490C16C|nr:vitamin B12-dependent ribonucleotide reductase [Pseudonocardia acaciae]
MTDAVGDRTRRGGKATRASGAKGRGGASRTGPGGTALRIERVHTTPGVHPYDEVSWERRDVVMTNWRDGSINFEQRGVEFPESWSMNATNIVTSKYFRGAVGTPQRENSLRQLIDRVVSSYVSAGIQHGYFATEADAEVFDHELTWMLLHQVFSFNSPVWFNVGTSSPQQVSACLTYDSLVSTPAGLVPIGELVQRDAVGTKVFDAHGITSILATKANGVREVIRLHTAAGHRLDVTPDHLVWKSELDGAGRWVEAGELVAGDHLDWHRTHSYGESGIEVAQLAEASLAGWLQAHGAVSREDGDDGETRIDAVTVTPSELSWVTAMLAAVFPDVPREEHAVRTTPDMSLDCRGTRLRGAALDGFARRWGLLAHGTDMTVPAHLFTAPLPVVACYLRSLFQAEGYVSRRDGSTVVSMDLASERLVRGVRSLLGRFGVLATVAREAGHRSGREGLWGVQIADAGDRRTFADEIGFIDPVKEAELEASFELSGKAARDVRRVEIAAIERLGDREVYDIQTESGEFVTDGLRVHNCFILSVDDTMESILNWYREEGLIFKGGSGAGLNLSRIRSSKELLSSGGTASGPVSFMRGADASAGTIKSGGATRRAAKMVVLDVDHPDIGEFVQTKMREEEKIRVLRDAGFDMDLGGSDIASVQYQNANNSVRVSDEFMRSVEDDTEFGLRARLTGDVIDRVRARGLFRDIAEAAWACADPGLQYDDTINDWHTCPESGRITASNPCSEYLHLDNSSCNLASLNLLKFLGEDGEFDADRFARSVELVITAMDISICFADFPTEAIGDTTRRFRQLGIGYANLGALLMATGRAYDSEGGRALAAAISSLMTGTAYRRSAELAGVVGPYDGYARNADAHQRVMRKHAAANDAVRTLHPMDTAVHKLATKAWQQCLKVGEKNGWRNAQASVIAPTGTIGLMMDCDTTGVEPDLALVKFKKLVGGGSMQIVNQTVPRALTALGYQPEQVEAIVEYVGEHGHVVDAPTLRPEHYEVFDCAMGERSIPAMGHVRMMAAVQPFISGAISKTVNMPESATVEDVEEIYLQGWRLGLKALAIYRDNCKVGQPLSVAKSKSAEKPAEDEPAVVVENRPVRRRLPKKRPSQTVSFTVGGAEGYLHAGSYPDDGLGEIFIKLGKQGSTLAGVMDAFSMSISVGLQYGIPLEFYVSKFSNQRFEPAGMTDDPDIRIATSVLDYLFRRLALDYLPYEKRAQLGIFSADERTAQVADSYGDGDVDLEDLRSTVDASPASASESDKAPADVGSSTELIELQQGKHADAPLCLTCGTKMRPAGSCYVCEGCGSTSGCS